MSSGNLGTKASDKHEAVVAVRKEPGEFSKFFVDFHRVFTAYDIAFFGGKALQRRALRTLLGVAAALSSAYLGFKSGSDQAAEVLKQSAILGIACYGCGYFVANISEFRIGGNLHTARKSFLDLMSHFKRTRVESDAAYLWDRVYKSEAKLALLMSEDEEPCPIKVGFQDFEAFNALFFEGLSTPYHQSTQSHLLGMDISLYEKWLSKDCFTEEDTLSGELIFNHALGELDDGLPTHKKALRAVASSIRVPFWHTLTMRKLAVELGKEIKRLNALTPEFVTAQHFLFPCEMADRIFREDAGEEVYQQLVRSRQMLINKVFSSNAITAGRHIARMFRADMQDALDRRLMVDYEFAAGVQIYSTQCDRDYEDSINWLWSNFKLDFGSKTLEKQKNRTWRLAEEFHAHLNTLNIALPSHPIVRRALMTAYLSNYRQLRKVVKKAVAKPEHVQSARDLLELLMDDKGFITRQSRIIRLAREFHAINELHLTLYKELVTAHCLS